MKKYLSKSSFLLFLIVFLSFGCSQNQPGSNMSWTLGPFIKADSINPIIGPVDSLSFMDPVREALVRWEAKDVFNPAAVVRDEKIYLLYRAEDSIGKPAGTSRIGLAVSNNGLTFHRYPKPVLYPENDMYKEYEWEGGCEDPRVVQDDSGTYYMTYTAYNGKKARLFVATSKDLVNWTKHGSAFSKAYDGKYFHVDSKSGAIVCRLMGDRFIATKINSKYCMYFGDTDIFLAYSEDLINWTPVEKSKEEISNIIDNPDGKADLLPALQPRKGKFDSELVESGPYAMITKKGILLIYNSRNRKDYGDTTLPAGAYSAGQALFNANNPGKLIARTQNSFIKPDKPYEITGQVNNVCFVEGLAHYKGKWFLYYGTADTKIAVAVYTPKN
jgi:beta-1,2-mannosidase